MLVKLSIAQDLQNSGRGMLSCRIEIHSNVADFCGVRGFFLRSIMYQNNAQQVCNKFNNKRNIPVLNTVRFWRQKKHKLHRHATARVVHLAPSPTLQL